jgi:hypothetical protein
VFDSRRRLVESWANRKPAVLKTAEPAQAGVRVQVHGLSSMTA